MVYAAFPTENDEMKGITMRKILIAIDGSEGASRAVDYVGRQFAGVSDLRVTLFHALLGEPPQFWDDGHLLTEDEKKARKTVIDKWLANQKGRLDSIFQKAIEALNRAGIGSEQIVTKFTTESIDVVARCILAEARAGDYQTLVIGRCGRSQTMHLLLGSIASQILNAATGLALCVVG